MGDEIVIVRTGSDLCPVVMLKAYIQKGGFNLFRPIVCVNSKSDKLKMSGSLTYSRMWELLAKPEQLGFQAAEFSLHSLRAGSAMAAAIADILDRDFKCHGC